MGILNITPDSFADGGLYLDPLRPRLRRWRWKRAAPTSSTSAESRRGPGSEPISADDEIVRVRPVIARLARSLTIPISIDTSKPAVAEVAMGEGASIINDVTGLRGAAP